MNDRDRIEFGITAMLLLDVLTGGTDDVFQEKPQRIADLLRAAYRETISDLLPKQARKINARSERAFHAGMAAIVAPFRPYGRIGLAILKWISAVIEADYLRLTPGSNMDVAMKLIAPLLLIQSEHADVVRSDALALHAALQRAGYFAGFSIEDYIK